MNPGAAPGSLKGPWRQPVVWVGAGILSASLIGCVLMITLALRQSDGRVPPQAGTPPILRMPVERTPAAGAAPAGRMSTTAPATTASSAPVAPSAAAASR